MSQLNRPPTEVEKHDAEHVEIQRGVSNGTETPNGGVTGLNNEARAYDPKWEKKTVRKIDVRLLIIRECHCP